jgi:RNA polymerase sigma-70 factor (ECF subfamily)
MNKNNSDKQLIASLKAGDANAMTEIYNRYWRKMLLVAYNLTKDKSTAQEIVQQVLIKLWDRRDTVNIDSLPNYLAVAVKYSVYTYLSREKRRSEVDAANLPKAVDNFDEEKIYANFLQEYISGVVDTLPEKCKLVFKYSRENGKTIPEIARDLSISEKTVEAHLTKALKSIKYSLKNSGTLNVAIFLTYFLK